MRWLGWTILAFALLLPGCLVTPSPGTEASTLPSQVVLLRCDGADGGVPTLESSFFDSCWGHIGHHTYFFDPPVRVQAVNGSLFAVEVESSAVAAASDIALEASLDGLEWHRIAAIAYPLGSDSGRYEIPFNVTADEPARFLRFSMPRSAHEGLAGYLDHSWANVTATALDGAPPLPTRAAADCTQGRLDSFFAEHPCWFGGYDPLDAIQGGEPSFVHATVFVEESWFDSPSFLHTYALGEGFGGPITATVRTQLWRASQHFSCAAFDPTNLDALAIALVQASADGRSWTEVARATAPDDEEVELQGEVPDGSRFLRFGTDRTAAWDRGACHHSRSFVVASSYSIG